MRTGAAAFRVPSLELCIVRAYGLGLSNGTSPAVHLSGQTSHPSACSGGSSASAGCKHWPCQIRTRCTMPRFTSRSWMCAPCLLCGGPAEVQPRGLGGHPPCCAYVQQGCRCRWLRAELLNLSLMSLVDTFRGPETVAGCATGRRRARRTGASRCASASRAVCLLLIPFLSCISKQALAFLPLQTVIG